MINSKWGSNGKQTIHSFQDDSFHRQKRKGKTIWEMEISDIWGGAQFWKTKFCSDKYIGRIQRMIGNKARQSWASL